MAFAAVTTIFLAGACRAAADPVGLVVIDRDTGEEAHVWRHGGGEYIAGEPGHRYGLRVANHSNRRVLVVLSVDGVNVYDGETASYDQGGYVLSPHETTLVTGWRKSMTEVAAFTFSPLSRSYAARTGRPANVGVIGMAVFNEYEPPPVYMTAPSRTAPQSNVRRFESPGSVDPPPPLALPPAPPAPPAPTPPIVAPPAPASRSMAAAPKAQALAEQADEKLGTGHGDRERSVITIVSFVRATTYPESTRQIEYDTRAHLVASGVIPSRVMAPRPPHAFPGSPEQRFVPDPPGDS